MAGDDLFVHWGGGAVVCKKGYAGAEHKGKVTGEYAPDQQDDDRSSEKDVKQKYLKGESGIAQLIDAEDVYLDSKLMALNSQYEFLEQLVWVQRSICAVNWVNATPEARNFIKRVKEKIEKRSDIQLL